jgi:hypothetical protein
MLEDSKERSLGFAIWLTEGERFPIVAAMAEHTPPVWWSAIDRDD